MLIPFDERFIRQNIYFMRGLFANVSNYLLAKINPKRNSL